MGEGHRETGLYPRPHVASAAFQEKLSLQTLGDLEELLIGFSLVDLRLNFSSKTY